MYTGVVLAGNASSTSGAGHVRRLIEISRFFPSNMQRFFYGKIEIPWLQEMANNYFINYKPGNTHQNNLIILLDSYDVDFCFRVKSVFSQSPIFQIGDLSTTFLPGVDIIFLETSEVPASLYKTNSVVAHGINFFPLRQFPRKVIGLSEVANNVLISTGGVPYQPLQRILLNEFKSPIYENIVFHFMGENVRSKDHFKNIFFYPPGSYFDQLAAECDTAISAAGTTLWDLLSNRLLVGAAMVVENQRANFLHVTESDQALPIYSFEDGWFSRENIKTLFFNSSFRQSNFKNISNRYDFIGSERIVDIVLNIVGVSKKYR